MLDLMSSFDAEILTGLLEAAAICDLDAPLCGATNWTSWATSMLGLFGSFDAEPHRATSPAPPPEACPIEASIHRLNGALFGSIWLRPGSLEAQFW